LALLAKPLEQIHSKIPIAVWKLVLAAQRSAWTKAASGICILLIVIFSLLPQDERVTAGLPGKVEHFLAYGVTGLLLALSIRGRNGPFLAAAALAWIASLLEFLQQWSPGRHPRVSDALVSAVAAMLGAGLAAWLGYRAQVAFTTTQDQ